MSDDLKSQIAISKPPLRAEDIFQRIHTIRGQRFPEDFMFRLSQEESDSQRSQTVILKPGRGKYRKLLPYAFTGQGVAMLSGILQSHRAVHANIAIMRAFVRMRRMLVSHEELARKVAALEGKYDSQFRVVFDAIRALMEPPKTQRQRIGF